MSEEFDDTPPPARSPRAGTVLAPTKTGDVSAAIARGYAAADARLRARALECLTRPLGVLSLMGVAAGAFARVLMLRLGGGGSLPALDDGARFTTEQIVELVRFVEQVSPQALHQCLLLLTGG